MSKQTEALKLALEALEVATTPLAKDRQEVLRAQAAIREALAEQAAQQQEPVRLRRGNILRCIETDELCTVWSTSTTGKTLVKWKANDFGAYTTEQIGELFWLEPEPNDLELAAENSDNYAAFHAGYRFAVAHSLAEQPAQRQEPVAYIQPYDLEVLKTYSGQCQAVLYRKPAKTRIAIYTSPPASKPWVGLTNKEWQEIVEDNSLDTIGAIKIAIEAKLKEKNA